MRDHSKWNRSRLNRWAHRMLDGLRWVRSKLGLGWVRSRLENLRWVRDLWYRDRGLALRGLKKKAEESALEKSSEIDVQILGWTMSALGDDDSLEKFFEAIPGFFNSKLVNYSNLREHLPDDFSRRLSGTLDGFLDRTLSYNSVSDSVKLRRLDISMEAINLMREDNVSSIMEEILFERWDQVPQTVEMGHTLARWCTTNNQRTAQYARCIVTKFLVTVQERDDRWVELAARISGLPKRDLLDNIAHGGENLLLAALIDVSRRAILSHDWVLVKALTQFDIRHTLPGLQDEFCSLWNEFVQNAGSPSSTYSQVLSEIRHLYVALHAQASPSALQGSPRAYPSCRVAIHRTSHRRRSTAPPPVPNSLVIVLPTQPGLSSDPSPHHSTSGCNTLTRGVKEIDIITGPPSPYLTTSHGEIADSSQPPAAFLPASPIHTSSHLIDVSPVSPPSVVAATPQNILPASMLSHPSEGTTQQDIVAASGEPDFDGILSTASTPAPTPTPAPVPASTPPIPNKSPASCDVKAPTVSSPLHPTLSVVNVSISATSPSHVPPLPDAESLSLLNSATPFHPVGHVTMPRLRARGFVNAGNMCFVNAALQLLVHSPLFSNLFRELGDLKRQHKADGPDTDGRASLPLVDATVRLLEEFTFREKEAPPTQKAPQQAAVRTPEEEAKTVHFSIDSFEPSYVYDAMEESRRLKSLLVHSRAT